MGRGRGRGSGRGKIRWKFNGGPWRGRQWQWQWRVAERLEKWAIWSACNAASADKRRNLRRTNFGSSIKRCRSGSVSGKSPHLDTPPGGGKPKPLPTFLPENFFLFASHTVRWFAGHAACGMRQWQWQRQGHEAKELLQENLAMCVCGLWNEYAWPGRRGGNGLGAGQKLLAKVNLKVFMCYCRRVRLGDMCVWMCIYEWRAHF